MDSAQTPAASPLGHLQFKETNFGGVLNRNDDNADFCTASLACHLQARRSTTTHRTRINIEAPPKSRLVNLPQRCRRSPSATVPHNVNAESTFSTARYRASASIRGTLTATQLATTQLAERIANHALGRRMRIGMSECAVSGHKSRKEGSASAFLAGNCAFAQPHTQFPAASPGRGNRAPDLWPQTGKSLTRMHDLRPRTPQRKLTQACCGHKQGCRSCGCMIWRQKT